MSLLDELAERHDDWVRMAGKLGAGDWSEDIVQEMYLRLHRYVDNPDRIRHKATGEINTFFVYITISNMVKDLKRAEARFQKVSIDGGSEGEWISQEDIENALQAMDLPPTGWDSPDVMELITEELNSWHWYDKQVFKIFLHEKTSLRKLSKETGISVTSLFNTMKNAKERIKESLEGFRR